MALPKTPGGVVNRGFVGLIMAPDKAYRDITQLAAEEGPARAIQVLEDIRDTLDELAELGFGERHTIESVRTFISENFKVLIGGKRGEDEQ